MTFRRLVLRRSFASKRNLTLVFLSLIFLVSACSGSNTPAAVGTEALSQPTQVPPTPTLTPEPPKVLNVCLAQDPGSLYLLSGRDTLARQSVFAAIYDQEILFEKLPSYAENLAVMTAVDVYAGMNVVDSEGDSVVLKEGTLIYPVSETTLGEPAAWSASAPLQMMQVSASYAITPGLLWSDGSPMTSADFLLSYAAAKELRNPQEIWLLDRTARLEALDETTILWTGVPGFVPVDFSELIIDPLPAVQFSDMSTAEIGSSSEANDAPLGWGPYRIVDRADTILLESNPYYVQRAAYDQVIINVESDLQQAIGMLTSGACDVLDPSYHLEAQSKDVLAGLAESGNLVAENFNLVQQLVFGIQPSAYDSGYSPWTATRQDFFGDLRTRQAIAACLTAAPIASEVLGARLPDGFTLPEFAQTGSVEQAQALLDEIGWQKDDTQPNAPRIASGVSNVLDGTVFSVSLLSSTSAMDREVSQAVVQRLGSCGIEVTHQALTTAELYAPGPGGVLFGRQFDLALVTWQGTAGDACELYRSDAVPSSQNYWIGTNLAGLNNAGFDLQCAASGNAVLEESAGDAMLELLPALPLVPQIRLWATSDRVDLAEGSTFADLKLWQSASQ